MQNFQNAGKLVKSLAVMQDKANKAQKELAASEFTGTAANGAVTVRMNGEGKALAATINPAILDEGVDILSDLIIVAINDAHRQKEEKAKAQLANLGVGLLPAGFKLPGLGM